MLIIETAIAKLGKEHQMRQTQEELAELIVAINKYERSIGNPLWNNSARKNVIEEMADVLIMLDAVKKMLDIKDEDLKSVREYKLNRLFNRLKEGRDL